MMRTLLVCLALAVLAFAPSSWERDPVRVASKKFTESVILGEMAVQLVESSQIDAQHYAELGGTRVAFEALLSGEIDIYPEYTGTLLQEIFAKSEIASVGELREALREQGILMTQPLGFNNTYALGLTATRAAELGVSKISELRRHPDLKYGMTNEFMDRGDGWPALSKAYGLPVAAAQGLDHDIAYRQLQGGSIDVMDVYATDAKIRSLNLTTLTDDLEFFPKYDAVLLFRADFAERFPQAAAALQRLEGTLDAAGMVKLNHRAEIDRVAEPTVAADCCERRFRWKRAAEPHRRSRWCCSGRESTWT